MYEFRALLDRFWVTRAEDRELYFSLKRALPDFRRLVNELLGWNLVVNESVVKLEKVPPRAMPWMGIGPFRLGHRYVLRREPVWSYGRNPFPPVSRSART